MDNIALMIEQLTQLSQATIITESQLPKYTESLIFEFLNYVNKWRKTLYITVSFNPQLEKINPIERYIETFELFDDWVKKFDEPSMQLLHKICIKKFSQLSSHLPIASLELNTNTI